MKRNQSKEWEISRKQTKIPNLVLFINTVDPYIQSLVVPRTVDVKCKRKASFWNLAIPVEKLFLPCVSLLLLGQLVLCWIPPAQREHTPEVCRGRDHCAPGTCSPYTGCLRYVVHTYRDNFSKITCEFYSKVRYLPFERIFKILRPIFLYFQCEFTGKLKSRKTVLF